MVAVMNFKNFKLIEKNKLLLVLFAMCAILLNWLIYSLNVPVKYASISSISSTFPATTSICSSSEMLVPIDCARTICMADNKIWSARVDGMCYIQDVK